MSVLISISLVFSKYFSITLLKIFLPQTTVQDFRGKLGQMQGVISSQRQHFRDLDTRLSQFHADLHEAIQSILQPELLVLCLSCIIFGIFGMVTSGISDIHWLQIQLSFVLKMYAAYVTDNIRLQLKSAEMDPAVEEEYARQRVFLEKTVTELKLKLQKDTEVYST